ncbi:MAG: hypothetical protein Q9202_000949 [Teloschistes flavicans]
MVGLARSTNKLQALAESSVRGDFYQSFVKVRILGLLLVRDAIVGLNQTAFMLGAIYDRQFVRTLATVSIRNIPVAIFEYSKDSPTPPNISPSPRDSDLVNSTSTLSEEDLKPSLTGPTPDTNLSRFDSPLSGWATSSVDPRLRIHYELSSETCGGGQMFMTVMDALALASTHPPNANVNEPITATGKNDIAETRLRIEPSGAPGTSFSWDQLLEAVVVFWDEVVFWTIRPRWNILETMLIRYDSTTIAYAVMTTRLLAADSRS